MYVHFVIRTKVFVHLFYKIEQIGKLCSVLVNNHLTIDPDG